MSKKVVCVCKTESWSYARSGMFCEDAGTEECWQGSFILKSQTCRIAVYFLEYSIAYLQIEPSSIIITNRLLIFDQMRESAESTAAISNLLVFSIAL